MTPPRTDLPALVARLRELASRATPGPWCWEFTGEKSNEWAVGVAVGPDDKPISGQLTTTDDEDYASASGPFMDEAVIRHTFLGEGDNVSDAAFIAACDPQTILALCDALTALAPPPEAETTVQPTQNEQDFAVELARHFGTLATMLRRYPVEVEFRGIRYVFDTEADIHKAIAKMALHEPREAQP